MTDIDIRVVGGRSMAAHFRRVDRATAVKLRRAVQTNAQKLKTRIQANASGRPGPNVITGDYRRSWSVQFQMAGDAYMGTVGTNAPQGRRLEHGFVGVDRAGRHYDQPPFPHAGPAFDQTQPEFAADIAAIVDDL